MKDEQNGCVLPASVFDSNFCKVVASVEKHRRSIDGTRKHACLAAPA